jgi:hypothetical protein
LESFWLVQALKVPQQDRTNAQAYIQDDSRKLARIQSKGRLPLLRIVQPLRQHVAGSLGQPLQ